jgi:hypothetical protein
MDKRPRSKDSSCRAAGGCAIRRSSGQTWATRAIAAQPARSVEPGAGMADEVEDADPVGLGA